ncbi:L-seryl-tRNA(Sec) selenium transferase [Pullulanibacillus camelliae]|uniref:L-seryl-tRNA(Sec) selenium transferase n=1 Tax=Pullulanibacillus camelliae TaxID=1707096 RepID=A0A8J3E0W2_9BACL|nr:L-seryl-tRNA(Sec) selenium transferase [Pullulanibacillus camelliae]GGE52301.1 L-seryl-tRNA(Sec) selenium transferase [Pullulanibacillus camelliae]
MSEWIRHLPSIKQIQDQRAFADLVQEGKMDVHYLTRLAQEIVQEKRGALLKGSKLSKPMTREELLGDIMEELKKRHDTLTATAFQAVINATGIVLHTNLGRARLNEEAAAAMSKVAAGYSDLEFDLTTGRRGSRNEKVEQLLTLLTGAEAALVVNNNAAAVFLILRAYAKHREVIVSRGELIEIGGSFRISSIMEESDAHLIEVGTTNKTHEQDYIEAINDQTAMVLKVHHSNFKMSGFTAEVPREELITLAQERNILYYEDLGSGAFYPFEQKGIGEEPTVQAILAQGADLVSMSGDKLLGGPQAGIILGKKSYIDRLKKHQLMRTLRTDKMTLAALAMTLQAYLNQATLEATLPTIQDIIVDEETLHERAGCLCTGLNALEGIGAAVQATEAYVGGGTMPDVTLPSYAVVVQAARYSAEGLARALRAQQPAIVGRVEENRLLLDVRTIREKQLSVIVDAFKRLNGRSYSQ